MKGQGDISFRGLNSFLVDAYVFLHVGKDIYSEFKKKEKGKHVKSWTCCNVS